MDEKIKLIVFMVFLIFIVFFWTASGLYREIRSLEGRIEVLEQKFSSSSDDQATWKQQR